MANKKADGLRGKDNEQDTLRDDRQGAYDAVADSSVPDTNQQTPHERAQPGADVRGDPIPTENYVIPEGLQRKPTGAYGKATGRGEVPKHVPLATDFPTDGDQAQRHREKMQHQEKAEGDRRD